MYEWYRTKTQPFHMMFAEELPDGVTLTGPITVAFLQGSDVDELTDRTSEVTVDNTTIVTDTLASPNRASAGVQWTFAPGGNPDEPEVATDYWVKVGATRSDSLGQVEGIRRVRVYP